MSTNQELEKSGFIAIVDRTSTEEEKRKFLNLGKNLNKYIIGQDEAISAVADTLRRVRAGLPRRRPGHRVEAEGFHPGDHV